MPGWSVYPAGGNQQTVFEKSGGSSALYRGAGLSLLNTRSWVHERRSNAGQLAEGLSSIASTGYRLKGRPNSDTCWADLSPDFAPQRGETSYAAIRS
jgi:hypothetical protein